MKERVKRGGWTASARGLICASIVVAGGACLDAADTIVIHIVGEGLHGQYVAEGDQSPRMIDVPIGTTVVWKNDARKSRHSATGFGKEPLFSTGAIGPGATSKAIKLDQSLFQRSGGKDGGSIELPYHCTIHGKVVGKLRLIDGKAYNPKAPATYSVNANLSIANGYAPTPVVIKVGDTISWTNTEIDPKIVHTATGSVNGVKIFDTGDIAINQTKSQPFTTQMYRQAGGATGQAVNIPYSCSYDSAMTGTVALSP